MDSLLFDLDGTLWNACETIAKPWTETFKENGINKTLTASDMQSVMGMTISQIAETFLPDIEENERMRIATSACKAEIPYLKKYGGALYPDLEKTLFALSLKYKLFIVSNCEDDYLQAFFNFSGLKKYFIDYAHIGHPHNSKSENIKAIIDRYSLSSPIYIGDTHMDFEAAKANSVPFIFASYGFGNVKNPTASLKKISDLTELCKNL